MTESVFIVDCPTCKAKVGAVEKGRVEKRGWIDEAQEPWATQVLLGVCQKCSTTIVGTTIQTKFENIDSEYDEWEDVVRVFPDPPKLFSSYRIPKSVLDSLGEAEKSMQAGAYMATCVMLGRALEGLCRDVLKDDTKQGGEEPATKKRLMLWDGMQELHKKGHIDERLFQWSQELHAFRNLSAHPDEDFTVSRVDAEDLQIFANAITEYVYDLTDRYKEFKDRRERIFNRRRAESKS
jgi:hypothetical protein